MLDPKGLFELNSDRPLTTIESAVRKLRYAIMQGDLRPGQKLVEANLCRELDISRASLREALRGLQTERLIDLVPNRGPSVAKLERRDVEDIQGIWSLLTGEAVYRFAEIAGPAEISALETAFADVKRAVGSRVPLEVLVATNNFFMTIAARCGNAILRDLVVGLVSRINFLRAQALLHQGWNEHYSQEIAEVLEAIRAKNPGVARRAVQRHIASACASAQQMIGGPPARPPSHAPKTAERPSKSRTSPPPRRGRSRRASVA